MEKFGIFELLDALSALTAPDFSQAAQNVPPQTENISPPRAEDAAFSPPVYGGYAPERAAAKAPSAKPQTPAKEQDALSSLLARQEEISRRIDKRR